VVVTGSTRNRLVPLRAGHVGSNPTLSAKFYLRLTQRVVFRVAKDPQIRQDAFLILRISPSAAGSAIARAPEALHSEEIEEIVA
jgi:hypothetical protein